MSNSAASTFLHVAYNYNTLERNYHILHFPMPLKSLD